MGKKAQITYDDQGKISRYELPENFNVAYDRNKLGQITKITDPIVGEWLRSFDPQGRIISAVDPLGNNTTYTYDNRNRVSGVTFPDLSTLSVEYDGRGKVVRSRYFGPPDIVSSKGGDPGEETSIRDNHEVIIDNSFDYDDSGYLVEARNVSMSVNVMGNIDDSNGLKMEYIYGHKGYLIKKINYGKDKDGKELDLIYTYDTKTGSQLQSMTD
jgi:YD repeat-containing protein